MDPDVGAEVSVTNRDIEEPDEVLDATDENALQVWEEKQRDLLTSVLDYNLDSLADLIQTRRIDLSPTYQRRSRWNATRQSRLIESFLMNVPVPAVFLNEDRYGQYSVIDGKQRLTAIFEFLRGRLRLRGLKFFKEINGKTIDNLPEDLQAVIQTRANLRAIIILRQSHPDLKFEVFRRLNTGGVSLNPQEIRNSVWPGPLNDLILDLSTNAKFHSLLNIGDPSKSAIYQEMRDAEFVLRFFTFRNSWRSFSGGMMRELDRFMERNQRVEGQRLSELRDDFLATLEVVRSAFGEMAFRRWEPEHNRWRRQVLASLYDAEMFACRGRSPAAFAGRQTEILNQFKGLFSDDDFRRSIDAATNQSTFFRSRIERVNSLLNNYVGS